MWKSNSALSSNCYLFLPVKWPQDTVSISVVTFVWLMWVSCQGNWLILPVRNVWTESSFCWAYYDKSCGFNLYVWVILFKWLQKKWQRETALSSIFNMLAAYLEWCLLFVVCHSNGVTVKNDLPNTACVKPGSIASLDLSIENSLFSFIAPSLQTSNPAPLSFSTALWRARMWTEGGSTNHN